MSKQTNQVELGQIIAQKTALPQNVVEAFINQLFKEIENDIINDSYIKLEGLGLFRVIKSGTSNKILYLGSKDSFENSSDISKFKEYFTEVPSNDSDNDNVVNYNSINETIEPADSLSYTENTDTVISPSIAAPKRNRESNLIKTCIFALIILAVLGIGYLLLNYSSTTESKDSKKINFIELDNSDTTHYSYIIIPESDVSLQYISQIYYGNEIFWPYIYKANEDFISNSLTIQSGLIIKIPKIEVDLIELHTGKISSIAKDLGDQILQSRSIK